MVRSWLNILIVCIMSILLQNPVDKGCKLNVHKTFRRLLDVFWTSYVRSGYVLCLLRSSPFQVAILIRSENSKENIYDRVSFKNIKTSYTNVLAHFLKLPTQMCLQISNNAPVKLLLKISLKFPYQLQSHLRVAILNFFGIFRRASAHSP